MSSDSRTHIMAKVRHGSHGLDASAIERELKTLGTAPSAPLASDDLCVAFLTNVLRNRGTVALAKNRSEAVKAVGQYIYERYRSHRLVAGNDPHLAAMPWRDGGVLPRFGELEAGEAVALSYARWGIAEMGAVVTWTGKNNPAANNLLGEDHIVILDDTNLVSDMEALWEQMTPEMEHKGRPRGINLIAGPSSTADIEMKMIYGAHGPRGWHVILLGESPATALEEARSLAGY